MPIKLNTASGGGVILTGANTASDKTITVPADNGTMIYANSSGNVGIGTSSPDALLTVNTVASFGAGSAAAPSIAARGDLDTGMWFAAANAVSFSTGGTERVRIDGAGDLYVGLDASSSAGRLIARRNLTGGYETAAIIAEAASSSGNAGIALHCPGSNAPILRAERGAGNNLDSVNSTQSAFGNFRAAAFTVVSDYRIKENVVPLTNALNRISHLKPSQFNFVEGSMMYNGGVTIDGFIAHEVSTVVPEAVIGNKDAVKEDGTPNYQSLDQAKLIPLLTAAIQEQQAMIDELKAKVAALEAR